MCVPLGAGLRCVVGGEVSLSKAGATVELMRGRRVFFHVTCVK